MCAQCTVSYQAVKTQGVGGLRLVTYCGEGIAEVQREQQSSFAFWHTSGIQSDHHGEGGDGGDNADDHDQTTVVPFVAEISCEDDGERANNASGYV